MMNQKPRAVIVGGSIAGISCAHALIKADWEAQVLEKSSKPPASCSTGAGLGLDPLSQRLLQSWLSRPELFLESTLPLATEQNRAIGGESKKGGILTNDENFNFRAAHWADLHSLLYNELPPHIFLWGHLFLSHCMSDDKASVKIEAKVVETAEIVEIVGDLIVAADGYYGWRGVYDFSENENSETVMNLRKAYPEIGKCLYLDLPFETHIILFELPKKKLNWVWFVNQPQPQLKAMVRKLHEQVDEIWAPEFARVVRETKDPFINVIYDCEPLEQLVWDSVVLIGEAAHPTTPHCARSTNMALLDAAVLGKCLEMWGAQGLKSALDEYQSLRLPVISAQVLHSWRVGRIKQGLALPDREPFNLNIIVATTTQNLQELQIGNTPFLHDIPPALGIYAV